MAVTRDDRLARPVAQAGKELVLIDRVLEVSGAEEVLTNWERLKADESGGRGGVDADIPKTLPALARAAKVQRGKPASRSVGDSFRRDDSVAMARTHGG